MSTSLKLSLLDNINSPEIDIIQDTAFILEEMLKTV